MLSPSRSVSSRSLLLAALCLGAACSEDSNGAADMATTNPDQGSLRKLDPSLSWYGDNRAKLDEFISRTGKQSPSYNPQRPPVAAFDLDNTILKNDAGDATLFWMLRNDKVMQPPMKNWKLVSPFFTADALQSLNIACDAVAAPSQPLSTSTSTSCATELAMIYTQGKTSGGKAAFAGWDYRRMEPAYALAAQLLSGYSAAEVKQMAKTALQESITAPYGTVQSVGTVNGLTAWMRVYDQIRDLIETQRAHGFDVWIISASPQPVVEAAAERVGISADHVIGIRSVERAGKLTYDLQGCGDVAEGMNTGDANVGNSMITYIDGKRCWLNKIVWGDTTAAALMRTSDPSKRPAFAAGDSDTDITFLQDATGLRLAINRNKKEIMCNAYRNAHGTWLTNPMFIDPLPKLMSPYACSTSACKNSAGMGVACRDEDGAVIPDQSDGVFAP